MKKLLMLMMALAMTLSLAACGSESTVETPPAEPDAAVVTKDPTAKSKEDITTMQSFFDQVIANYQGQQTVAELLDEVKSGQKEESALLDAHKQLAEDSAGMLSDLQNTAWATNFYDDKVAILTDCVVALELYQRTVYEASADSDDAKLSEVPALFSDYDTKLTAFLDAMGVK